MWLFTKDAFLSIVADKDNPDAGDLLVRARRRDHIPNVFPDASVFSEAGSDYAYRAWVPREEVKQALEKQIDELSYTNFKNAIDDNDYHNAAINVWFAMYQFQR